MSFPDTKRNPTNGGLKPFVGLFHGCGGTLPCFPTILFNYNTRIK
nr:MAG TPA: hypothetical protein [Caudoviricetes sp.]